MALGAGVNQGIGFGMTFYLQDEFTQTASRITAGMTNLDQLSNQYANSVKGSFSRGFNDIASGVAGIAGAAAMLLPLGYGLKMAGEFEAARIQLETLLKSKDVAASFFEDLKKDALILPLLNFKDLAKGSGFLIAAGVAAQTAREDLNNLAKSVMAVGGTRDAFNRMAYNLSQVKNQGKATGHDMRQFAQANLPIGMYLQRVSGKKINDKNITYDDLAKAFALFARENDMSLAMLNSINGQTATLKENFGYLFAGIGEAIKPLFVSFSKSLNNALQSLTQFVKSPFGKFIAKALSMVLIFVSLATAVFYANKAFGGLKRIIATLFFDLTGILSITRPIIWNFVKMAALFWAMTTLINSNSGALVTLGFVMSMFMGKMGMLTAVFMLFARAYSAWQDFISGKNKNLTGVSGFFIKFGGIMAGVLEIIANLNNEGWTWTADFESKLREAGVLDFVTQLGTVIHGIYRAFVYLYNFFGTTFGQIVASTIAVIYVFYKLSNAISAIGKGIGLLGKAFVWLKAPSSVPFIVLAIALIAIATTIYLIYRAWANWDTMTRKQKIGSLVLIFITLSIAIGTTVGAFQMLSAAFAASAIPAFLTTLRTGLLSLAPAWAAGLAPLWATLGYVIAITAAIAVLILAIKQIKDTYDNWTGFGTQLAPYNDPSQQGIERNALGYPMDYGQNHYKSETPLDYLNKNGGDMRDIKSLQNQPSSSSSQKGDSGYQPVDQTIILQLDGYELHRQLITHGDFNTARS